MSATSASHKTEISCAFFNKPDLRLEKVTCLLILFSILFNCTLPLPILNSNHNQESNSKIQKPNLKSLKSFLRPQQPRRKQSIEEIRHSDVQRTIIYLFIQKKYRYAPIYLSGHFRQSVVDEERLNDGGW